MMFYSLPDCVVYPIPVIAGTFTAPLAIVTGSSAQ
jgi:hypothetical protein